MTRAADDIGKGLAPARRARPIETGERVHVIGAAGAGASAAMLLAHYAGARVSGCDPGGPSPYTAAAAKLGLELAWEHSPAHVAADGKPLVRRAAVTKALTSIDPDNAELVAARVARVVLEPWQQLVADAAATQRGRLAAVAGTHGKSTVAGWLVHALNVAGRDPAAFVGALLPAQLTGGIPATARWGSGDAFIVEADEYAGNFDAYRPQIALLLNAEWDHPDVFPDETAVFDVFERWLRKIDDPAPTLVANAGNPGVIEILRRLADWPGDLLVTKLAEDEAECSAAIESLEEFGARPGGIRLVVAWAEPYRTGSLLHFDGTPHGLTVSIELPGRHNAENALAVVGALSALMVPFNEAVDALAGFRGVGRRLELKGEARGVTVLDDYGHHPTAIGASLAAVRSRYPGRHVWAVYEPLTYHRTAAMLDAFADVLASADRVAIADIWAGRDSDTTITSAAALADAVNQRDGARAVAPGSVESTADYLCGAVESGDVVLIMGGGRSYVIAERLVDLLRAGRR